MARERVKCITQQLNKIETKVYHILRSLRVPFTVQTSIDKYNVDFLVDGLYIIECYGDFWHCNPHRYAPDYWNRGKNKCAKDIWERDAQRRLLFEQQGYKFLSLWESEINQHPKKVKTKIKRFVKNNRSNNGFRDNIT